MVVNALPGSTGLEPTIEALRSTRSWPGQQGEPVMAGRLISRLIREEGATLLPIDSEHSALYQLMQGSGRTR